MAGTASARTSKHSSCPNGVPRSQDCVQIAVVLAHRGLTCRACVFWAGDIRV